MNLEKSHFDEAMRKIRPLDERDLQMYSQIAEKFSRKSASITPVSSRYA